MAICAHDTVTAAHCRTRWALALLVALSSLPARADWDVQGLPLLNYNSDNGVGYGARVLLIERGEIKPYRLSLGLQFFQTTKGIAAHLFFFDAPAVFGTRNRIDGEFAWAITKYSPYYGVGNDSVYRRDFDSCDDRAALAADPDRCPGNPEFRGLRYYRYRQETLPRIKLNLRRDLGGPFKLFAGYRLRFTRISTAYGIDDLGQTQPSQLAIDAAQGKLAGWDGADPRASFSSRTAELTGGLVYDTRDEEPFPARGMFHEASLRAGLKLLGGQHDYRGFNTVFRFYQQIAPRLVAAVRLLLDAAAGDVPFWLLPTTGGLAGPDSVGGESSVRGLLADRFQGNVKTVGNAELRWRFLTSRHVDLGLSAGLDAGRVWRDLGSSDPGPIHLGSAVGLRVAWNKNFVIRFDYGIGLSDHEAGGAIYLTFDELY